jgi:RNase P protein component
LFIELSEDLSEGSYIFVAKKDILTTPFSKLQKDLRYALKRVGALKHAKKTLS